MTQVFRVELEGVDITEKVDRASISKQINRFYNVASVTMSDENIVETILGKDMSIFYGSETFSGIAFETSKNDVDQWQVILRTYGAKLTEPFSASEEVVEDATSALSLCSLYENAIGLTIDWQTVDLDFGGSYERKGTMLTALTAIANTVGAEYFDDGDKIVIQGSKTIGDVEDHILRDDEYFDFISSANSLYNAGVGTVRTSTGAISTGDVIEENKINMEVFEDGTANIYCIPNGAIESSYGIDVLPNILTKVIDTSTTLINETVVYMKASIKNVMQVKINGIEVTSYKFQDGHSALYFEVPQSGYIEITYEGYYQDARPIYTETPNGNLAIVELYYLNQVLKHYWYLDALINTSGVRVYIEKDATIYRGFKAYMLDGGVPKAKLYANGVQFDEITASSNGVYVTTNSISLSPATDPEYEYRIPSSQTVLLVTSFGKAISPVETIDGEEKVLTFDRYYPRVELTVEEAAKIITVDPTRIEGEILLTMEDLNTNEISEHDIGNIDENDINSIPCELDQFVPIDVVSITGKDLQDIIGMILLVTAPSGETSTATIQPDGIAKVWVPTNGDYIIDTKIVTGRSESYITLRASV